MRIAELASTSSSSSDPSSFSKASLIETETDMGSKNTALTLGKNESWLLPQTHAGDFALFYFHYCAFVDGNDYTLHVLEKKMNRIYRKIN